MPVKRFRGTHYRQLLLRLPRNLLVFDGHCTLCQARARFVLERNFSYFSLLRYAVSDEVEAEMAEGLDRHRLFFASLDSQEGADVRRAFFQRPSTGSVRRASTAAASPLSTVLPIPEDLVLIFVEKVPSATASFLGRVRRGGSAADDLSLFGKGSADPKRRTGGASSSSSTSTSQTTSAQLVNPEVTDLLVSTNFSAMCRVGMHLDRVMIRSLFRLFYSIVPTSVGDWWFDRYVSKRRQKFWGTTEQDAVKEKGIIEGIEERRWTWRAAGSNLSK